MPSPRFARPAALLLLLFPALARGQACDDFSAYRTCPPAAGRCLLGPGPRACAQDCSTCTARIDDDGDCVSDEELLNDRDDDGDGLIDEDISCLNTCDPITFECPTTGFPDSAFAAPDPLEGGRVLTARLAHWTCAGAPDDTLDLIVELGPAAVNPRPFCGGFSALVRLRDAVPGGAVHFEGPAIVLYTRRWESLDRSLVAGAQGNIEVFRYLIKADLRRLTGYPALPAALQVPCNEDQAARKHLFLYGYLDLARDAAAPGDRALERTALALIHPPGTMSHPLASYDPPQGLCGFADVTRRPIPRGSAPAHDGEGWSIVAPAASFTFSAVPAPIGEFLEGRIRQVPTNPGLCHKETRICESHFEAVTTTGTCLTRVTERRAAFCGQDDGSVPCPHFNLVSASKCATVPNDHLAFLSIGAWSGSEFPGSTSASLIEGGWICQANFEPYWYGVYTETASTGPWRGPERAIDVVDNQVLQLTGLGQWLIGSVNWFDEGGPNERFAPRQFRVMHFFPAANPDIPRLAPCVATAAVRPGAPGLCPGGDLDLTGADSAVVNCCQCGGLEYQWLKRSGPGFVVVRPWDTDPAYRESPGPALDTDYKLEVRCSTSRTACADEAVVTVSVGTPVADAGPDRIVCSTGPGARIGTPAVPGLLYTWTPSTGLDDPASAEPLASPAATKTYLLHVARAGDPTCFSEDSVEVRVDLPPGRVSLLRGVRTGVNADFTWSEEPAANGGYHVYRVLDKVDVPAATTVGMRVIDTPPDRRNTAGTHPGAVPGAGGTVFFYQAVAVCIDDLTEGPM